MKAMKYIIGLVLCVSSIVVSFGQATFNYPAGLRPTGINLFQAGDFEESPATAWDNCRTLGPVHSELISLSNVWRRGCINGSDQGTLNTADIVDQRGTNPTCLDLTNQLIPTFDGGGSIVPNNRLLVVYSNDQAGSGNGENFGQDLPQVLGGNQHVLHGFFKYNPDAVVDQVIQVTFNVHLRQIGNCNTIQTISTSRSISPFTNPWLYFQVPFTPNLQCFYDVVDVSIQTSDDTRRLFYFDNLYLEQPLANPLITSSTGNTACFGQQVCFNLTETLVGATFSWFVDGGVEVSSQQQFCTSTLPEGSHIISVTQNDGCRQITSQFNITINPLPVTDLATNQAICLNGSATLMNSVNDGGVTYIWDQRTGLSWQPLDGSAILISPVEVQVSPKQTTSYRITATDQNTGCTSADIVLVVVNENIKMDDDVISICSDDPNGVRLTHNGSTTYSYIWSPATGLNDPNAREPRANPSQTTTYTVTATSPNGCVSMDQVEVRVGLDPVIQITQTSVNCDCKELEAVVTGQGPFDYRWDDTYPTDEAIVTVCPPYGRDYELDVEDANGCETTTTVFVEGWADYAIDDVHFVMEPSGAGPYTDHALPEKYVQQQVISSQRAENNNFGTVVEIAGDYAAVNGKGLDPSLFPSFSSANSSPQDVIIFHKNTDEVWDEVQIIPNPGVGGFGYRMAMDGNLLAIAGGQSIYVYQEISGIYSLEQVISSPVSIISIDLDGYRIAIASNDATNGVGEIYVWDANPTFPSTIFTPSGQASTLSSVQGNSFGISIGVSNDRIVVGAPKTDYYTTTSALIPEVGAAHVFNRNSGTWAYEKTLLPPTIYLSFDELNYGFDVDISNDNIIIGAPNFRTVFYSRDVSGKAFIYDDMDQSGIIDDDPTIIESVGNNTLEGNLFGYSVAIVGETAAIGSPRGDINGMHYPSSTSFSYDQFRGHAVAVFKQSGGWGRDSHQPVRVEVMAFDRDEYDYFGYDVDISGDYLIAGAPGQNTSLGADGTYFNDYADGYGLPDPYRNTGTAYFSRFPCLIELQNLIPNTSDPVDPTCNNPGIFGLKDFGFFNLGAYNPNDIYALGGTACGLTQTGFERGASTIDPSTGIYYYTLGTSLYQMDNQACNSTELTLPPLENYTSLSEPEFDVNTGNVWLIAQFATGYDLLEISLSSIIAGGNQPMTISQRISLGTNAPVAGSSTFDPINQKYYYVVTPTQMLANTSPNPILGTVLEVDVNQSTTRTFEVKDMDGVSHTLGASGDIVGVGGNYSIQELEYNALTGDIIAVANHYIEGEGEVVQQPGGMGGNLHGGNLDNPHQPVIIRTIKMANPNVDVIRFGVPNSNTASAYIVVTDVSYDAYSSSTFDDQNQIYYVTASSGTTTYVVDVASETMTTQVGQFTDPKNKPNIFEIEYLNCVPSTTANRIALSDVEKDVDAENLLSFQAIAYPNPNGNGRFDVTITVEKADENISLQVIDIFGKVVEEQLNAPLNTKVDISQYAKGIYFLRVTVGEETQIKKLIYQ